GFLGRAPRAEALLEADDGQAVRRSVAAIERGAEILEAAPGRLLGRPEHTERVARLRVRQVPVRCARTPRRRPTDPGRGSADRQLPGSAARPRTGRAT